LPLTDAQFRTATRHDGPVGAMHLGLDRRIAIASFDDAGLDSQDADARRRSKLVSRLTVTAVCSGGSAASKVIPVAESSMAAKNPPCTVPCRLVNSGFARNRKVADPVAGSNLTHSRPNVAAPV
jgi:hypothetical protein